eukprot:gene31120-6253_t
MVELTEILGQLYEKLVVFISGLDAGTLQVTGIFGLALAWLGYLQFRGGPSTGPEQPARPAPSAPRPAGHQAQRQVAESAAPVAAAPKPVPREPERAYSTPLAKAVDTTLWLGSRGSAFLSLECCLMRAKFMSVSIVRQIEPDLHIDGHSATVEDLQRFIPQLWLVGQAGAGSSMSSYPNVAQEKSLQAFFPS